MPEVSYPIEMVNGVPVVAAPAGINISNADWLQAVLLEAAARGHATFVVDMTCTQFCASAGVGPWCGRTSTPWPNSASCRW
jgi:anti-anti-sigma regulatory factor